MLTVVLILALACVAAIAVAGWLLARARTSTPPQPGPEAGTRPRDPHEYSNGGSLTIAALADTYGWDYAWEAAR